MYIHPVHAHEIYRARQKERKAEARMYRFKRNIQGESLVRKLATDLGSFFTSVQTAVSQMIRDQPQLVGSKDTR